MKTLFITSCLILINFFGHSQVKINYSSYDMWKNDSLTGKAELVRKVNELGYFELNKEKATVLVYNETTDKEVLFEFTPFQKGKNKTYFGLGKTHLNQMVLFDPERAFILFVDEHKMQSVFVLKESDVNIIIEELKEDPIIWDINDYRGEELKQLVKENHPDAYLAILALVQHKMEEFSKENPLESSETYFSDEVSRQCFAYQMIRSYIDSYGIDAYLKEMRELNSVHTIYIDGKWNIDNYSMAIDIFR